MHFPTRLYGIENEFAVVAQTSDGTFIDVMDTCISNLIQATPTKNSVLAKEPVEGMERVWHTNGSCTYVDTGDHPEHATAECLSVRDVVKYNKAGEVLVSRVFDGTYSNQREMYWSTALAMKNIRFLLFKNNLGYNICADTAGICGQFGCHENYSLSTDRLYRSTLEYNQKLELLKPLIPFLATRQIFDGSGWWETDGTFHLSQRAFSIQREIGSGAMADRSFFQIKTGDTGVDARLHIVSGDANMCEFALYLKLGITSLVLALLESGCCPILDYKNVIGALKQISRYGDPHMRLLQIKNNSALSALEVQSIFFEALRAQLPHANYANEEIEEEVKHIMLYWEQTLNAVYNRDDEWMRGRIDYATKRSIAEMQIHKMKIHNQRSDVSLVRKTIDIMYHCVSNPTLQDRIKARWPERRIVSDDEICHCLLHAPPNTRARMRGIFVQTLIDKGKTVTNGLTWNQFTVSDELKNNFLDLPDGFISNSDEFEKFLLLLK